MNPAAKSEKEAFGSGVICPNCARSILMCRCLVVQKGYRNIAVPNPNKESKVDFNKHAKQMQEKWHPCDACGGPIGMLTYTSKDGTKSYCSRKCRGDVAPPAKPKPDSTSPDDATPLGSVAPDPLPKKKKGKRGKQAAEPMPAPTDPAPSAKKSKSKRNGAITPVTVITLAKNKVCPFRGNRKQMFNLIKTGMTFKEYTAAVKAAGLKNSPVKSIARAVEGGLVILS